MTMQDPSQAAAVDILAACIATCDTATLLNRFTAWGQQLTDTLRQSTATMSSGAADAGDSTAVATCTAAARALSVLLTQLLSFIDLQGVKREVSGIAAKAVPQLPVLLDAKLPSDCVSSALSLLESILKCVPATLRQQAMVVRKALTELLLTVCSSSSRSSSTGHGGSTMALSDALSAGIAGCLAALPRVTADAATWSELARQLLLCAHDACDFIMMGLEPPPVDAQYRSYLEPAGQLQPGQPQTLLPYLPWQPPPPARSDGTAPAATASTKQPQPAIGLLSTVLQSLEQLLTSSYPVAVPVPSHSVALLAARLVRCDLSGSLAAGAVASSSTMLHDLQLLQPWLQITGWKLLQLVLGVAQDQLLPQQGVLVRVAREGLRSLRLGGAQMLAATPCFVRQQLYVTCSQLLTAFGFTPLRQLATDILGCSLVEIYGVAATARDKTTAKGSAAAKNPGAPKSKRQKTQADGGLGLGQFDPETGLTAVATAAHSQKLAVADAGDLAAQAVAVEMLGSMLIVGGAVLPAEIRAHADSAVFHIAHTCQAAAARISADPAAGALSAAAIKQLQLAAYDALLASILSPCGHRPPYISQVTTDFVTLTYVLCMTTIYSHVVVAGYVITGICAVAAQCCVCCIHTTSAVP